MQQHSSFDQFFQTQLNPQQKAAAMQPDGTLLVIAGAGSGKTRIITARMAYLLLHQNALPESIVALTFTNKAAKEMKHRLERWLVDRTTIPYVGTFHSYCLFLLRNYSYCLNIPQFSIMDSDDQLQLLRTIIKKNNLSKFASPSQLAYQISDLKNKQILNHQELLLVPPLLRDIYREYEAEKTTARCFDFDDLLIQTLHLFKTNSEFKTAFQTNIRHLLVDEYQDTSIVQHELLKEMALNNNQMQLASLCAVGDEDQSIYSWRGATVANMIHFTQDFAPVSIVKVEQNYRSVKPILETANHLIKNNTKRNPKTLWSDKEASQRILIGRCYSADQEAQAIVAFLSDYSQEHALHDCAILYRTHYQSRPIEEALIRGSIPYNIVGGIRFYERKEIKDLLAYLRLLVNPFDKVSLMRVINCPARGLGQKFEEQLLETWHHNALLDFRQILYLMSESEGYGLKGVRAQAVQLFLDIFESIDDATPASQALQIIIEKSDYLEHLRASFDDREAETKIENVHEFLESVIMFEKNNNLMAHHATEQDRSLNAFLHEVALLQEKIDAKNSDDQIQLMTLHAAKGLEFHTVILSGVEEGILPNTKALNSLESIEEERRLLYVGITRAREYLLILHAHRRYTFGQLMEQSPSQFLDELPATVVSHVNIESLYPTDIKQLFSDWRKGRLPQTSSTAQTRSTRKELPRSSFQQGKSAPKTSTWQKHQSVKHPTFGTGLVLDVEQAPNNDHYITILFKDGKKRILGSYLKK